MSVNAASAFKLFADALVGQTVSHVWRGAGSAMFLEFGPLRSAKRRRDGSVGNPSGQMSLMIEWSWRIEESVTILCGSWSDETMWPATFDLLRGQDVSKVETFGRLPEIEMAFGNGMYLLSFMTADGDPQWTIFDRRRHPSWRSIGVRDGELNVESGVERAS